MLQHYILVSWLHLDPIQSTITTMAWEQLTATVEREYFLPGFFAHFGVNVATNIETDPANNYGESESINQTATDGRTALAAAAAISKPTISPVSLVPIGHTAAAPPVVGVI